MAILEKCMGQVVSVMGHWYVANFSGTLVMTLTDNDIMTKVPSITTNIVMVW